MKEIEKIKSWFELPLTVQKESRESIIFKVNPYDPFKVKKFLLKQMLNNELPIKRDIKVISQTQLEYIFK